MSAKQRILKKYPGLEIHRNPKEYSLYTQGEWHKKLLLAVCRKYGVKPYRYKRQKYTTVMVNINETFLNEILWKEFQEYSAILGKLVEEITDDLISKIHKHEDEDIIQGKLGLKHFLAFEQINRYSNFRKETCSTKKSHPKLIEWLLKKSVFVCQFLIVQPLSIFYC